jgi:hypothetical protein
VQEHLEKSRIVWGGLAHGLRLNPIAEISSWKSRLANPSAIH